jgi:hypothetical protein
VWLVAQKRTWAEQLRRNREKCIGIAWKIKATSPGTTRGFAITTIESAHRDFRHCIGANADVIMRIVGSADHCTGRVRVLRVAVGGIKDAILTNGVRIADADAVAVGVEAKPTGAAAALRFFRRDDRVRLTKKVCVLAFPAIIYSRALHAREREKCPPQSCTFHAL